jgi:hypothetical protein
LRILLGTDVLLDVALARKPFAPASREVLRWAEAGGAAAVVWHSVANSAYVLKGGGQPFLERLLHLVEVAPVATADVRCALDLPLSDVEAAAGLAWQADAIVTCNLVDYRRSPIPPVTPTQFLKRLRSA